MRRNAQYQPTVNQQLSDAQEVHYAREFKKADIAGGYRKSEVIEAKDENPNLLK
ncbi:YfhE family protein [Oceanobacillus halophilus]|uniref:YfhE family protein n=1 Tax=Oceanobacillus halophilus TaxID=930130 RepID=A0A494ZWF2_9BACI|nr:YfhE family protein [Oceanobacillus halophilus]RKQ30390.1 YfhE family protein [Oceanobacillus halophilus]